MEINRNQYFMIGIVVLLLGIQLRLVESYVLTAETTKVLAEGTGNGSTNPLALIATTANPNKVIHPPAWAGWALASIGAVLILHSLAMPKPG